jgi:hypothetical protein
MAVVYDVVCDECGHSIDVRKMELDTDGDLHVKECVSVANTRGYDEGYTEGRDDGLEECDD